MKKWLTENSCSLLLSLFNEIPDLLSDVKEFKEALNEAAVKLVHNEQYTYVYNKTPNSSYYYICIKHNFIKTLRKMY